MSEKLTYKEVQDAFLERDSSAVTDFQNSPYSNTTEGRIAFLSERLEDVGRVLAYVLRRLAEEESEQP